MVKNDSLGDRPRRDGKRGRPKGTVRTPPEHRFEIWRQVEFVRESRRLETDRRPSVSEACELIASRGGLAWAVGGDVDAITRAMERSEPAFSRWRQFRLMRERAATRLVLARDGRVIVSYLSQHGRTLRTRYTEADRLVRTDSRIRAAWTNMVYDMLGLPRPFSGAPRIGVGIRR
jgi:YD repeat-containing protein